MYLVLSKLINKMCGWKLGNKTRSCLPRHTGISMHTKHVRPSEQRGFRGGYGGLCLPIKKYLNYFLIYQYYLSCMKHELTSQVSLDIVNSFERTNKNRSFIHHLPLFLLLWSVFFHWVTPVMNIISQLQSWVDWINVSCSRGGKPNREGGTSHSLTITSRPILSDKCTHATTFKGNIP